MQRRDLLAGLLAAPAGLLLASGRSTHAPSAAAGGHVMTVDGPVAAAGLGFTLAHEHLYADLRPYPEQQATPLMPDDDDVLRMLLPRLQAIRRLGCRTLVDCTATTLGRQPRLIQRLAHASGLRMLTTTGAYLAAGGRFIPQYVVDEDAGRLAARWLGEWRDGIDGSGIRPGLIKLGIESDPLTALDRNALDAAAVL